MKDYCFFKNVSILCLFSLILISCGGGSNNTTKPETIQDNPALYQGSYAGNYTGTTTGSWRLTVDADGNVTGTTFTMTDGLVTIDGLVRGNGKVTVSGNVGAQIEFIITIEIAGNVTGTWTDKNGGKGKITGKRKSTGVTGTGTDTGTGTVTGKAPVTQPTPPIEKTPGSVITMSKGIMTSSGEISVVSTDSVFGNKTLVAAKSEVVTINIGTSKNYFIKIFSQPVLMDTTELTMDIGMYYGENGELRNARYSFYDSSKKIEVYSYAIGCPGGLASVQCAKIQIAADQKSISFLNVVMTPFDGPDSLWNRAEGTLTITGTVGWK